MEKISKLFYKDQFLTKKNKQKLSFYGCVYILKKPLYVKSNYDSYDNEQNMTWGALLSKKMKNPVNLVYYKRKRIRMIQVNSGITAL